jgi:hypothetical protein
MKKSFCNEATPKFSYLLVLVILMFRVQQSQGGNSPQLLEQQIKSQQAAKISNAKSLRLKNAAIDKSNESRLYRLKGDHERAEEARKQSDLHKLQSQTAEIEAHSHIKKSREASDLYERNRRTAPEYEKTKNRNLEQARREAEARQMEKAEKSILPKQTPKKSIGQKIKGIFNKDRLGLMGK